MKINEAKSSISQQTICDSANSFNLRKIRWFEKVVPSTVTVGILKTEQRHLLNLLIECTRPITVSACNVSVKRGASTELIYPDNFLVACKLNQSMPAGIVSGLPVRISFLNIPLESRASKKALLL
jgi:hypothetical protein